jgi:ferritin-like metal-binding protein YciE
MNAYKIAYYRSAYLIAVELELDTATDLLQQVLEWEIETSRDLALLAIEEFNQSGKVNL